MTEDVEPEELAMSRRMVLLVLGYEDELTPTELADRTRLSRKSVRNSLDELEEKGLVTEKTDLADTRQRLYSASSESDLHIP